MRRVESLVESLHDAAYLADQKARAARLLMTCIDGRDGSSSPMVVCALNGLDRELMFGLMIGATLNEDLVYELILSLIDCSEVEPDMSLETASKGLCLMGVEGAVRLVVSHDLKVRFL